MGDNTYQERHTLSPYFSMPGACAFSVGTSIGWGSFIVTCTTYLSQAGILGTVFGLLIGMAVIFVINRNLCYMIERNPDAGGIYSYGKKVAGHDAGFLIAWMLLLTYMAVLWANITSLPLFARRFFGSFFQFGYCYTLLGYDVYIGEVLLSVAALCLTALLCTFSRRIPQYIMIAMAVIFIGSVLVCAATALVKHGGSGYSFDPQYIPDKRQINQIVRIAVISPWAFIGFENVAHFSEEMNFPVRKIRTVMLASVLLTTGFYVLMTVLSVTAYPPQYSSWLEYIRDMGSLSGIEAVPALYAGAHYMGNAGVGLLMLALLSVVVTSMIGNLTAISRLLYAFGRDHEWLEPLSKVNRFHIPSKAVWVTVGVSCIITFTGRTAISWIVDVTTLGAVIIYGFLSHFVFTDAKKRGDRIETGTGITGIILMIGFAAILLIPKLMTVDAMEPESYLLFAGWALLGLIVFRLVLVKDRSNQYGHSVIVWVALLLLMLLTNLMWENRATQQVTDDTMRDIHEYYQEKFEQYEIPEEETGAFLQQEGVRIKSTNSRGTLLSFALFMSAVIVMMSNLRTARKREYALMSQLGEAREFGLRDSLTGVKNKHAYIQWEDKTDAKIEAGDADPFAVVVCDINNLKTVNDMYGHKEGDLYICRACSHICRTYAHSPVFRYGGDEFVVLLFGEDYLDRHRLLEEVMKPVYYEDLHTSVSIAAGMSEFSPERHYALLNVFDEADKRMYRQKLKMKTID